MHFAQSLTHLLLWFTLKIRSCLSSDDNYVECPLERLLQDLKRIDPPLDTTIRDTAPLTDGRINQNPVISLLIVPSEISVEFQSDLIISNPTDLLMITNPKEIAQQITLTPDLLHLPSGVAYRVLSHHEFVDDAFAVFYDFMLIALKADNAQKLRIELSSWWLSTVKLLGSTEELRDTLNRIIIELDTNLKEMNLQFLFKSWYCDMYDFMLHTAINGTTKSIDAESLSTSMNSVSPQDELQCLGVLLMFAELSWNKVFELEMDCNSVYLEGDYTERYPIDIQPDHERFASTMMHLFERIRIKFMHKTNKRCQLYLQGTVLKKCFAEHALFTLTLRSMYWIYEWVFVEQYTRDISVVILNPDLLDPIRERLDDLGVEHEMYRVSKEINPPRFVYHQMLDGEPMSDVDEVHEAWGSPLESTIPGSPEYVNDAEGRENTRTDDDRENVENRASLVEPSLRFKVDTVKLCFLESSTPNIVEIQELTQHLRSKYPADSLIAPWIFDDQQKGYLQEQHCVFQAARDYFDGKPITKEIQQWFKLYHNRLVSLFNDHRVDLKTKVFEKMNHFVSGSNSAAVTLKFLQKEFLWTEANSKENTKFDFEWLSNGETSEETIVSRDVLDVIEAFILNLLYIIFQCQMDAIEGILRQKEIWEKIPIESMVQSELDNAAMIYQELRCKISMLKEHGDYHGIGNLLDGSCGVLGKWVQRLSVTKMVYKSKVVGCVDGDMLFVLPKDEESTVLIEMLYSMPQKVGQYFRMKLYDVGKLVDGADGSFNISVLEDTC